MNRFTLYRRVRRERFHALGEVSLPSPYVRVVHEIGESGVHMCHRLSMTAQEHYQAPRVLHPPQIVTESPATLLFAPRAMARKEA